MRAHMPLGLLRSRETVALTLVLGLALGFYVWTASSSGNPIRLGQDGRDRYNLLSDALLRGRASLDLKPPDGLLALPNPYDPVANAPFRSGEIHDLSLYQKRFYMYWGPTPAVTLFIPFRLLPFGDMPENLAVVVFSFVGLLFAVALMRFLVSRYLPETPAWMQVVAVGGLAFANGVPFLLRRPAVYEVAISAGYCFLFAGLFFLATGSLRERPSLWRLLAGSLLLGLAMGARYNLVISGLALLVPLVYFARTTSFASAKRRAKLAAALLAPFAACLVLILIYNRVRFDSFTELGLQYQLAGIETRLKDTFNLAYLPPGLWYYLIAPVRASLLFPYLFLPPPPGYPGSLPAGYDSVEVTGGILTNVPLVLTLVALPFLWRKNDRMREPRWVITAMAAMGIATVLLLSFTLWGTTMRYEVDFTSLLLVPALLVWFALAKASRASGRWYRLVAIGGSVLVLYGAIVGAAVSFTGYDAKLLRSGQPGTHETLEDLTSPLPTLATMVMGRPVMTEVVNPSGVEGPPLDYGTFDIEDVSFWMELNPTVVKVVSPAEEHAFLRAVLQKGPNMRKRARARVVATSSRSDSRVSVPARGELQEIPLVLERGLNRITLNLEVMPPPPRAPGDPIAGQVVRVEKLELTAE
jgi:hypothetical protein